MRVLSPRPELTIVPYVPGSVDEDKVILGSNESALVSSLRVLEVEGEKYLSPDGGSDQETEVREWRLSEYSSLKIIARFPFEGNARAPRQDALAVTRFTPEEGSGEDRTILVVQTHQTVLQEEIWALINHAD